MPSKDDNSKGTDNENTDRDTPNKDEDASMTLDVPEDRSRDSLPDRRSSNFPTRHSRRRRRGFEARRKRRRNVR